MLRRAVILCLVFCGSPVLAGDCSFVVDTSLCGLPLGAGQARFDALLGAPDGTLKMGPERSGVLYGRHLLIVFEQQKVVQVHSWARNEPAFLEQVGEPSQAPIRLTLENFNPWERSRQQLDLALEKRPLLAAEALTQTREMGHSRLIIRYRARASESPAHYPVDSLQLDIQP